MKKFIKSLTLVDVIVYLIAAVAILAIALFIGNVASGGLHATSAY